jgi:hypothetical protein
MQVIDMAKNNNLGDFLTDIANAIREKKGMSGAINAQDFAGEIESISTGGGIVPMSDVNFYDYDGTRLHSFTKAEFLALSALPELPTREGLICQGWNYTLTDAKNYVTSHGILDLGATYITDDGATRLHIRIAAKGRMTVPLYFSQTVANGVTIDWGDGSATQTLSGTGNVNTTHTYAEIGDYVISLQPQGGCTLGLGHNDTGYCVMGENGNSNMVYNNMLQKVEVGEKVEEIHGYAFQNCCSLTSIAIPNGVTSIGNCVFKYCYKLRIVIVPVSVATIGMYACQYCHSLTAAILSNSVTNIMAYSFYQCYSLQRITMPDSLTTLGTYAFQNCYSLANVAISNSLASLNISIFQTCRSLSFVAIPGSVKSIAGSVFSNCYGMGVYDFRQSTSIPTLSNSNAFNQIPEDCIIVIPDSLYSSWTTTTNWSSHSPKMVKASEYNG